MSDEIFHDIVTLPLLPVEDDHDTGGFFDAARRGELALRFCTACGQLLHLPRQVCFSCGGARSEWRAVPGRGRVHAWTVVTHQVHPAFPTPYTVVLVDLDEVDARLVGSVPGAAELEVGQPLRVRFDRAPCGTTVPNWEVEA
ncbi:Zn-ribbon domain-containing OB-fold protein [Streptomyces atratus]|uniref:Zn-ribbon domain-containing OB-fold protein n=1 Tax=Streptomyces atratus TaxID=1893 RepID=UPI0033E51BA5